MVKAVIGVVTGLAVWVAIIAGAGVIMRLSSAPFNRRFRDCVDGLGRNPHRPAIDARTSHTRSDPARRVHSAAHHAVGQVSSLVSPHVPSFARSSDVGRRDGLESVAASSLESWSGRYVTQKKGSHDCRDQRNGSADAGGRFEGARERVARRPQ